MPNVILDIATPVLALISENTWHARIEYMLTCSFGRYRLLFLGTPTLTPEPVFSRTSTGGELNDRCLPKRSDTMTVVTFSECLANTLFRVV